jgi:cell division protein FtsQ
VSGGAATVVRRRRLPVRRTVARLLGRISPRVQRWLLVAAAICLLLAGVYRLWLRDSSLVGVDSVTVTGLTTADAERVRTALTTAGRTMTTLHVDREALDRAVAGYPVVRGLEVTTDFPHGLRVRVIEHHPVAIAVSDAGRLPVAADGTLLRGLPVEGRLATVDVDGALGTDRLQDPGARAAAAAAGAAPDALRSRIDEVDRRSGDGLVVELRDGPELIFGNAGRLRAKWAAAARVLADLEARGATYVDLRIPGRPAAGGLAAETVTPVAPAGLPPTVAPDGTTTDPAASDPTVADPALTGPTATDPTATDPTATDPTATDPTATTPPATTTPPAGTTLPTQPDPVTQAPVTGGAEGGATATP